MFTERRPEDSIPYLLCALDQKRDWLTVVMMVLTWEILRVVN